MHAADDGHRGENGQEDGNAEATRQEQAEGEEEIEGHLVVESPALCEHGLHLVIAGDDVREEGKRKKQLQADVGNRDEPVDPGAEPETGGEPIQRDDPDDAVPGEDQGAMPCAEEGGGLARHDEAAEDEKGTDAGESGEEGGVSVAAKGESLAVQASDGVVDDDERSGHPSEYLKVQDLGHAGSYRTRGGWIDLGGDGDGGHGKP